MRFPSIRLLIPTLACTLSPPAAQAAAPRTRAMPTCSGDDNSGSDGSSDDFAAIRKVQGIGDTTLSAAWSFRDIGDTRLYVDLTGRVRLPTGNKSRGLGRGTTDYATLGEMGWDGDRGGLFVLGGRQYLESTSTVQRRDVWQASGGYWVNFGRASQAGMQATGGNPLWPAASRRVRWTCS